MDIWLAIPPVRQRSQNWPQGEKVKNESPVESPREPLGVSGDPQKDQKRQFVHNSVCSQFLEGLFAILSECSQFYLRSFIEIQEEIPHFTGWEGGGVKERQNCEQKYCEQTGVS